MANPTVSAAGPLHGSAVRVVEGCRQGGAVGVEALPPSAAEAEVHRLADNDAVQSRLHDAGIAEGLLSPSALPDRVTVTHYRWLMEPVQDVALLLRQRQGATGRRAEPEVLVTLLYLLQAASLELWGAPAFDAPILAGAPLPASSRWPGPA